MTDTDRDAAVQIGYAAAGEGYLFVVHKVVDALAAADRLCPPRTLAELERLRADNGTLRDRVERLHEMYLRAVGVPPALDAAPAGTTAKGGNGAGT